MIVKAQKATCTSHRDEKFQQLHKIAVGKKKFAKKSPVTIVFSFPHSLYFPSPSYSPPPFSLRFALAYTFLSLHVPAPFFLHPSISPSPLKSPCLLQPFFPPSVQHLSGRERDPAWAAAAAGLGC